MSYAYGNTRVRAMRSRLLDSAAYAHLLTCRTMEQLITYLSNSPTFAGEMKMALGRHTGVTAVLAALGANFHRALETVRQFFDGEPRRLFELVLMRWDRENLLALIRGQVRQRAPDGVLALTVSAGRLDSSTLAELATQPGLRAFLDLMITWKLPYADALQEAYRENPDLGSLEMALNRAHFAFLLEAASGRDRNSVLLQKEFKAEIDLINLQTGLRLAADATSHGSRADLDSHFVVPEGVLPIARISQPLITGSGIEGLIEELGVSIFGEPLRKGWALYQESGGELSLLQKELERWRARHFSQLFLTDPLSIAVPLGYIGSKEVEIENLRVLARGLWLGLSSEQTRSELILTREESRASA
ncbi:MAG: V-type ATPase subunit [Acidobacteria bacterium]|nr:V-type ATPase subunit [Acidobacteriota bacterium]